jgi:hypothetical protein
MSEKQKKSYKVIGQTPTLGHAPGKTFEATLSPQQEKRLIDRKAIEVVSSQRQSTPPVGGSQQSGGKAPTGKE